MPIKRTHRKLRNRIEKIMRGFTHPKKTFRVKCTRCDTIETLRAPGNQVGVYRELWRRLHRETCSPKEKR